MSTTKTAKTSNKKKTPKVEESEESEIIENCKPQLKEEDIRQKAVRIYFDRLNHGEHGTALSDWLQAEATMRNPDDEAFIAS